MTARRFSLADCVERVRRAARRDGLRRHHLNPYEYDEVLFDHPDVTELDLSDAAWRLSTEEGA